MAVNIDANSMPRKGAKYGGVTRAQTLGSQTLPQSNMRMNKGGTRPLKVGTKAPPSGAKFGSGQRKTAGVE